MNATPTDVGIDLDTYSYVAMVVMRLLELVFCHVKTGKSTSHLLID